MRVYGTQQEHMLSAFPGCLDVWRHCDVTWWWRRWRRNDVVDGADGEEEDERRDEEEGGELKEVAESGQNEKKKKNVLFNMITGLFKLLLCDLFM